MTSFRVLKLDLADCALANLAHPSQLCHGETQREVP